MTDFLIKKLPYDLSSHGGLAFIGKYLKRININALIDPKFPVRSGVANSDILKSYLALLCMGKSDFDAIESFRANASPNAFFMRALGLGAVASSPTLRQRMDTHAPAWFDLVPQMNALLLASRINGRPIDFGTLDCGYTPVDLDTFVMDNSGTHKELVGRTYTGVDGYCPCAVYLGTLGYCLELARAQRPWRPLQPRSWPMRTPCGTTCALANASACGKKHWSWLAWAIAPTQRGASIG